MVHCGRCGRENPDDAVFCWKCGSRLSGPARGYEDADSRKKDRLRSGYRRVGDDTIESMGREYDVSPAALGECRKRALMLVAAAYIVGFALYLAYPVTYLGPAGEFSETLVGIALGGYDMGMVSAVIVWAVVLTALTFWPWAGLISGCVSVLCLVLCSTLVVPYGGYLFGCPSTGYGTMAGICLSVLYMMLSVGAVYYMNRYNLPYNADASNGVTGALRNFYRDGSRNG